MSLVLVDIEVEAKYNSLIHKFEFTTGLVKTRELATLELYGGDPINTYGAKTVVVITKDGIYRFSLKLGESITNSFLDEDFKDRRDYDERAHGFRYSLKIVTNEYRISDKWVKICRTFSNEFNKKFASIINRAEVISTSDSHGDLFIFLFGLFISNQLLDLSIEYENDGSMSIIGEVFNSRTKFVNCGDYFIKDHIAHNEKFERAIRTFNRDSRRNEWLVLRDIYLKLNEITNATTIPLIEALIWILTFETYKRNCESYFIVGNHDQRLFEDELELIDDSERKISRDVILERLLLKSIHLIRSSTNMQVIHFQHGFIPMNLKIPLIKVGNGRMINYKFDLKNNERFDLEEIFVDGEFNRVELMESMFDDFKLDLSTIAISDFPPEKRLVYSVIYGHSTDYRKILNDEVFSASEEIRKNKLIPRETLKRGIPTIGDPQGRGIILDNLICIDSHSNSTTRMEYKKLKSRRGLRFLYSFVFSKLLYLRRYIASDENDKSRPFKFSLSMEFIEPEINFTVENMTGGYVSHLACSCVCTSTKK